MVGKPAATLVPDPAARAEIIQEMMGKGYVRNRERAYSTQDGAPLDVLMNADRITVSEKVFIWTAVENITERKRAEAELHTRED